MRLYYIIVINAQCTQKLGDYSCPLRCEKKSILGTQRCAGTRTSAAWWDQTLAVASSVPM